MFPGAFVDRPGFNGLALAIIDKDCVVSQPLLSITLTEIVSPLETSFVPAEVVVDTVKNKFSVDEACVVTPFILKV